jgi:hypothetical protein
MIEILYLLVFFGGSEFFISVLGVFLSASESLKHPKRQYFFLQKY